MENNNSMQSPTIHVENHEPDQPAQNIITSEPETNDSIFSTFVIGDDDIPPIEGVSGFVSAFKKESSKLWHLGGPAILTALFQFRLGAVTQTFAGHVGTLDLAAFSIANAVISGFMPRHHDGNGKCTRDTSRAGIRGRAGGDARCLHAALLDHRGLNQLSSHANVHLCRATSGFAPAARRHILGSRAVREVDDPQLYAYAFYFPITKFLQVQSKIAAMAWISGLALLLHAPLSWLVMIKLDWGMGGGILVLNGSWWFMVVALMIYIWSGTCGKAWTGFPFVKLSAASAVMLCLEIWYYTALILFAGYLGC